MFAGPLLEQRRENKEAVGLGAWLGQMSYEMAAQAGGATAGSGAKVVSG